MNKESPTTLRIFFFALAALSLYSVGLFTPQGIRAYFAGDFVSVLLAILGILLPVAFIYFGITLRSYLNPSGVRYLKALLFVMVILTVLNLVLGVMQGVDEAQEIGVFIWSAIDLLIAWVIYRNVMRLSFK